MTQTQRISEAALEELRSDSPKSKFAMVVPIDKSIDGCDGKTFMLVLDGDYKEHLAAREMHSILGPGENDSWIVLPLVSGEIRVHEDDSKPCAIIDLSDGRVFESMCFACIHYLECNVSGRLEDGEFGRWALCQRFSSM